VRSLDPYQVNEDPAPPEQAGRAPAEQHEAGER
jgi:hypothetical protein